MSPARLDRAVVLRRLRTMADALSDLDRLTGSTIDDLDGDPIRRAAAERLIQVVVDLAIDINAHVAAAALGTAPTTGRESFGAAATVGMINAELAERLAPSAGLRNVLVHRYVDIDLALVAAAIASVTIDYREYATVVADWLGRTD